MIAKAYRVYRTDTGTVFDREFATQGDAEKWIEGRRAPRCGTFEAVLKPGFNVGCTNYGSGLGMPMYAPYIANSEIQPNP